MRSHLPALLIASAIVSACADRPPSAAPGTVVLASDNGAFSLPYSCPDGVRKNEASDLVRGVVLQEVSEHILAMQPSAGVAARIGAVQQARESGSMPALEQAVVAFVCSEGQPSKRPPRFPEPGSMAAEFVLSPLDDGHGSSRPVRLSELRGQPVILTFWSTWCGPCRTGYPKLQSLAEHAASRGVALYAVVHQDQPQNVQRWRQEHGSGVRFLLDEGDRVAAEYRVFGVPHTVVIGADGRVRGAGSGYMGEGRDLTRLVTMALGE